MNKMVNLIQFPNVEFKKSNVVVPYTEEIVLANLIDVAICYMKEIKNIAGESILENELYLQLKLLQKHIKFINSYKHYKITFQSLTCYFGVGFNQKKSLIDYIVIDCGFTVFYSSHDIIKGNIMTGYNNDITEFANQFDEGVHYNVSNNTLTHDKYILFNFNTSDIKNVPELVSPSIQIKGTRVLVIDMKSSSEYNDICTAFQKVQSIIYTMRVDIDKYTIESEKIIRSNTRDYTLFTKIRTETEILPRMKQIAAEMRIVKIKKSEISIDKALSLEIKQTRRKLYDTIKELNDKYRCACNHVKEYRAIGKRMNEQHITRILNKNIERVDVELKLKRIFKNTTKAAINDLLNNVTNDTRIKKFKYPEMRKSLTNNIKQIFNSILS